MTTSFSSLGADLVAALAGQFVQHRRILRLTTPVGPDALLAESLRASEGISELFSVQVAALSLDAAIPLKSLIGQPVLVELLAAGDTPARPFHGYVTAAEQVGANGGFARYRLTIEPWLRFLGLGRDSRVFQDMTVCDIVDAVLRGYDHQGRLAPAWRFDLQDRDVYPRRSLTTQYQESDLAFIERLLLEEGLFYFFTHQGDAAGPQLGSHTMVIADHNGAFAPNAQAAVRFTQPGAVMTEDSIDRWRTEWKLQTNAVELASWDYRTGSTRAASAVSAGDVTLTSRDLPGAYAYASRKDGQRLADNQLQALQVNRQMQVAAGTVRTFTPATTFILHDHAGADGQAFIIVRALHLAHNNLDADTGKAVEDLIGPSALRGAIDDEMNTSLHAVGAGAGQRPLYRNRIDAIPQDTVYRASAVDGHGQLLRPRPTVAGQQTAIVVGPAGATMHTDRDHRIKVQFHWQRGSASHSRLAHPLPDGHTGAPADDQAGTWLRVATPLAPVAGANWGSHALPRVGQEVLVDFIDGNIDRPVVIGAVYNGAGSRDAQHNGVAQGAGAATGNAPAWFPGEAQAHAHPVVLSGIKSQTMPASQGGSGGFSQLVFDDSPGQARVALQRHAAAYQGTDELNLGHLRHQSDNQRLATAGFGAELKTAHGAAVRAGAGLLLSTDRAAAGSAALDSRAAASQVDESLNMVKELAALAQKHKAQVDSASGSGGASAGDNAPDKLPAAVGLQRSAQALRANQQGVTEYDQSQLQLSSPAGIAALTPADAIFNSTAASVLAAGQDIDFAAQANWYHSVRGGIGLFSYGKAAGGDKPNQETGIRLHSASGKVSSQSQGGPTRLTADKAVTVASINGAVKVAAKQHVLLTAQGAWLKLSGGNIEVHGPGTMAFKASLKELTGPASSLPKLPTFPLPAMGALAPWIGIERLYHDGSPVKGAPYKVRLANGAIEQGRLDDQGLARIDGVVPGAASIEIGEDERDWTIEQPDTPVPNPAFGKELTIEQLMALGSLADFSDGEAS